MARKWLEELINGEYIPFIEGIKKSPAGRKKLTSFTKDMRQSWAERGLTSPAQQAAPMTEVRASIKDSLGEDHWSLNIVALSTEEWIELNQKSQDKVAERNENVQSIKNPDEIVAIAVRLLESREWSEIAAGLSALTGRRVTELLSTAKFEKKSQWSVLFTGALKRRGEAVELQFEIPTLTTADKVIKALAKLRKELPIKDLTPSEINNRYEKPVASACDRHFKGIIPPREGKDNVYTHLNRSVYATIAVFWYCPPSINEVEFKAAIQGHYALLDEKNPTNRRSLASSRHYSDYEISDQAIAQHGGKRKGIKLGIGGVEPIEAFTKAWKTPKADTQPGERRRETTSLRIFKDTRDRWLEILEQVCPEEGETQQAKTEKLLVWIEQHLKESQVVVAKPVMIEAIALKPIVEAPLAVGQDQDALRQMILSVLREEMPKLKPSKVASLPNPQITKDDPEKAEPEKRGRKNSAEVEQRVNGAIDAIIHHNDQQAEIHSDKWEISINALKAFGASQRAIYRHMELRQEEITAHHAKHEIKPGHNLRQHRGKAITEVIQLGSEAN